MKRFHLILIFLIFISCNRASENKHLLAQQIVDSAIKVSGGENYLTHDVQYVFRDKHYTSQNVNGKKVLKRFFSLDSNNIIDIKTNDSFERFISDKAIQLSDSLKNIYSNSVNSVHYFSRLPYGLNDRAVKKELLGEKQINGHWYYKVKVTFDEENGGEDFEDIFLYWFDKTSFKPKFLAYKYNIDGGGIRFREAYNERYLNGIRFVDYTNLKPKASMNIDFFAIDSLYMNNELELLSKIELKEIKVTKSN